MSEAHRINRERKRQPVKWPPVPAPDPTEVAHVGIQDWQYPQAFAESLRAREALLQPARATPTLQHETVAAPRDNVIVPPDGTFRGVAHQPAEAPTRRGGGGSGDGSDDGTGPEDDSLRITEKIQRDINSSRSVRLQAELADAKAALDALQPTNLPFWKRPFMNAAREQAQARYDRARTTLANFTREQLASRRHDQIPPFRQGAVDGTREFVMEDRPADTAVTGPVQRVLVEPLSNHTNSKNQFTEESLPPFAPPAPRAVPGEADDETIEAIDDGFKIQRINKLTQQEPRLRGPHAQEPREYTAVAPVHIIRDGRVELEPLERAAVPVQPKEEVSPVVPAAVAPTPQPTPERTVSPAQAQELPPIPAHVIARYRAALQELVAAQNRIDKRSARPVWNGLLGRPLEQAKKDQALWKHRIDQLLAEEPRLKNPEELIRADRAVKEAAARARTNAEYQRDLALVEDLTVQNIARQQAETEGAAAVRQRDTVRNRTMLHLAQDVNLERIGRAKDQLELNTSDARTQEMLLRKARLDFARTAVAAPDVARNRTAQRWAADYATAVAAKTTIYDEPATLAHPLRLLTHGRRLRAAEAAIQQFERDLDARRRAAA